MMMTSLDFSSSSFEKTIWIKPFFESTFGVKTKTRSNGSIAAVEEGEGHGPRKEFFLLIGEQLRKDLFIYHQASEAFWINTKLRRDKDVLCRETI